MSVVAEIKQQIAELQDVLQRIQDECSHPSIACSRKAGSNTGNYDPSADSYWYDLHCGLCDKSWRTEQ